MRLARAASAAFAIGAASVADVAGACPSCASPLEENRQAFVDTTIFLTVVPLMMIGGLIWYLRRKVREREEQPPIEVPTSLLRDVSRFSKGR
jgi:hypothetical protein